MTAQQQVWLAVCIFLAALRLAALIYGLKAKRQAAVIRRFLALYRAGDFDKALLVTEELDKASSNYYVLRGGVLQQLGRLEEAEESLRKAATMRDQEKPQSSGEASKKNQLAGLAWLCLAGLLSQRGRFREAIECSEKSLTWWPGHGPAHRQMAEVRLCQGSNLAEALKWAKLAVEEDRTAKAITPEVGATNLGEALATLAWAVAAEDGDRAAVDRMAQEAVSTVGTTLVTSSAQVHYQCGIAYRVLGDTANSAKFLKRAAEIDRTGRWGRAAREAARMS